MCAAWARMNSRFARSRAARQPRRSSTPSHDICNGFQARNTSSTRALDDLDVERHYGDLFDDASLRTAMTGCDVVYYCVVDARMWVRDPKVLWRTNVEALRHVLDAAVTTGPEKFVFTSTTGTMAVSTERAVTEEDPHNRDGGAYIASRLAA